MINISPCEGWIRPFISFISVVLPLALGPNKPTIRPLSMERLTLLRASLEPYFLVNE